MAVSAMFTLAGYEFIRAPSTVLFKSAYGADNLPLVMAAMPLVVFLGVALYGRILSALGPRRTLLVTSLGSGLLIFCCYLLVLNGSKVITPVLFLTKELYIVLLIEQYWSYINSSLSTANAKKLNGPITGIGRWCGPSPVKTNVTSYVVCVRSLDQGRVKNPISNVARQRNPPGRCHRRRRNPPVRSRRPNTPAGCMRRRDRAA